MTIFKMVPLSVALLFSCAASAGDPAPQKDPAPEYAPSWESLMQYDCPEWFRDAKFGIWAHWGPQSVPEMGDWYASFLYGPQPGDSEWRTKGAIAAHAYHVEHYGHPSVFGYKDIIPLFKAENWDPKKLMKLYYDAGARYFVSMGQHHDNFDLWDSKHQPWNSVNMGPHRDIVREWQEAARENGMKFGVSFHGFTAWGWFECSRGCDTEGPLKGVPYDGNMTKEDGKGKWWEGYDPQDLYCRPHPNGAPRDDAFKQNYIDRLYDLFENYHPDLIYFDGGIPFDSLRIASTYYNRNTAWNNGSNQGVIAIKGASVKKQKAIVLDIENGQSDYLRPYPWQTDTSFDGWFVRKGYNPPSTKQIIQQLVDIVSKNGNLLLNIAQYSDGSISDKALWFLKCMAEWMQINGEAIHGSRPWEIYGEGPVHVTDGEQNKSQRLSYTAQDIRFTRNADNLYAFILSTPGQEVLIKSLPKGKELWFGEIQSIRLLGNDEPLEWKQTREGLKVIMPKSLRGKYVFTLKISGK